METIRATEIETAIGTMIGLEDLAQAISVISIGNAMARLIDQGASLEIDVCLSQDTTPDTEILDLHLDPTLDLILEIGIIPILGIGTIPVRELLKEIDAITSADAMTIAAVISHAVDLSQKEEMILEIEDSPNPETVLAAENHIAAMIHVIGITINHAIDLSIGKNLILE